MAAINTDYKNKNEIAINFAEVKSNTIKNLYNYYQNIISDFSKELYLNINGEDFNLEKIDDIVFCLKSATTELTEFINNIHECTSVTEIISALKDNSNFESDDAMIFYLLFDTPVIIS